MMSSNEHQRDSDCFPESEGLLGSGIRLWKVFWLVYVPCVPLCLLCVLLLNAWMSDTSFSMHLSTWGEQLLDVWTAPFSLAVLPMPMAGIALASAAVWFAAPRSSNAIWTWIARGVILSVAGLLFWGTLLGVGAVSL